MKKNNILAAFIAVLSTVVCIAQTNPTPYDIKLGAYVFKGFDNQGDTNYPPAMAGWRGPLQTLSPTASTTAQATADEVLCISCSAADVNSISNEGANGISIRTAMSAGATEAPFAVVLSINTLGAYKVNVSWKGGVLPGDPSVNDLSVQALSLQYRLGNTGNWVNINAYRETDFGLEVSEGSYSNLLPAEAENQAEVQLRWMAHTVNNIVPTDRLILNTIFVKSDSIPGIANTGYCDASGAIACPNNSCFIENAGSLFFGNSNESTCALDSLGYSNFTSLGVLFEMTTGDAFDLYANVAVPTLVVSSAQVAFYFDWNQDNDFDDLGETITTIGAGNGEYLSTVTVPADAKSGVTRMRVRSVALTETLSPCGTSGSGEVEDYTVKINNLLAPAPACLDTAQFFPKYEALDVCNTLTFVWPKSPDTDTYKFYLYKNDQTDLVSFDTIAIDTSFTYQLDPSTVYVWKVIPFNENGDASICDTLIFTSAATLNPNISILPAGDTLSVCNNNDLQLNATTSQGTAPYTYTWTGNNLAYLSSTNSDATVFNSTANMPDTNSFVLNVTDALGCSGSDVVVITTINQPVVATLTGTTTICEGDSATLMLLSNENFTIQDSSAANDWTTNNLVSTAANEYTTGALNQTTAYRVITFNDLCAVISPTVLVTVNNLPAKPNVVNNTSLVFCSGDSVTLSTANYTDNIVWSNGVINDSITIKQSGNYTAKVSDSNGCVASSDTVIVTINALPVKPTIQVIGNLVTCENTPLSLVSSYPQGNVWSDASATTSASLLVTQSGKYAVRYTDANSCSSVSDSVMVTINPQPVTPIIAQVGDSIVCINAGSGFTYTWFDSTGVQVKTGTQPFLASPQGAKHYYLVISTASACKSDQSNFVRFSSTGIAQLTQQVLKVYPNPSSGSLWIENPNSGINTLLVYDLFGKLIKQTNLNEGMNQLEFDLSHGAYQFLVLNDKSIYRATVLIQE